MPQFRAEIPEIHTRITRPIIKQILDDVLPRFKEIPFREFRFPGDSEAILTPGSAIDGGILFNRELVSNYVDVEVEDLPDDEYGRSFQATNQVNHFIFRCEKTKLDLFPVYQNRKLTINFKVVCSSRVRLNGLVTRMTEAMRQSQTLFTHLISYNYDLPTPCVALINKVYDMMQANYPYPDLPPNKWFEQSKVDNLQIAYRQDGKGDTLVYKENAVNVLSNLTEHEEEPRKNKDAEVGVWNIEFDLEVRYQRPSSIRVSYPPIIHNQFLDESWFNKPKTYDYTKFAATSSLGNMAIERFKWNIGYGVPGRGDIGCKEPYFDDWGKDIGTPSSVTLLTALSVVDEADLRYFFNPFTDLTDYQFPEEIQRLMKIVPEAMLYSGKHFIGIKAYSWNDNIRPEHLSFEESGKIITDFDLNPRNYYHIVFSFNADPTNIHGSVWDEALCELDGLITYFGVFGDKYSDKLKAIIAELKEDHGTDEVCLTRGVIDEVIRDLIEDGNEFENGKLYWDLYPVRTRLDYRVIGEI